MQTPHESIIPNVKKDDRNKKKKEMGEHGLCWLEIPITGRCCLLWNGKRSANLIDMLSPSKNAGRKTCFEM